MDVEKLGEQYKGGVASSYDAKRSGDPKWVKEQEVIEDLFNKVSKSQLKVLDVPVGTGRFVPLYKKNDWLVTGMDISEDMLKEAKEKAREHSFDMEIAQGSIFDLAKGDSVFDLVVCIRFLNWINFKDFSKVVGNLAKTSKEHLILGVRAYPKYSFVEKLKQKIKQYLKKKRMIIIHSEEAVLETFAKNNLSIIDKKYIDTKQGGKYYVFLLHKNNNEGKF